jgi:Tol biopolymer transport system component
LTLTTLSFGPQEARVLRFPAVSNGQIVFSCAGDLYTVPIAGGVARKLTSFAEGYEAFARFSPDGSAIAFTGEYDGIREVYLIPAGGGAPERIPLPRGGSPNKPEFAPYSPDGKSWIIEGVGVEPDIVVDNDPAREYAGVDDQLNKAIEVILEDLKTKEREIPPIPPYPIKK